MKNTKSYRLVLFPLPFPGHMTPMLHLAAALHSKGFSITIIHTCFGAPNRANYPDFVFRSIEDGVGKCSYSDENIMGLFNVLRKKCLKLFEDCLWAVMNESGEFPVACLISDPMWLFAGDVARGLNLHNLVLRTGSASASVVYNSLQLLVDNGYYSAQETRPNMGVTEFPPLRVKDLPVLYGDNKQTYLKHFSDYASAIRTSSGFICNSFDHLEADALSALNNDLCIPIFPVGPINKNKPIISTLKGNSPVISWLNKHLPKSVIYVSYGSNASITITDFVEIAYGLAHSLQPFLWAVRPGLVRGSKREDLLPFPNGFLEMVSGRGLIVKWASQVEVLAHSAIGGFLSHCGWNSVLESVAEGVPLICSPCFADQMMNARCVSDLWRVGIFLENGPRKDEIVKAIRRVLLEEEGTEIRDGMLRLKAKAHITLQEGGTSYQSMENLVTYILSLPSF